MAAMHGKAGTATFSGLSPINLISWTVDSTADVAEITDMADTWKTYLAGFKDWTATMTCHLDSAGSDITTALATSQTLTIDTNTGLAFSGTAICTGSSASADKDGIVAITYNFQGSGALGEA